MLFLAVIMCSMRSLCVTGCHSETDPFNFCGDSKVSIPIDPEEYESSKHFGAFIPVNEWMILY